MQFRKQTNNPKETLVKSFFLAVAVTLALCSAPALHATCAIQSSQFSTSYRDDVNGDLNDLGRIFEDAGDPACAQEAMWALEDKIHDMLAEPVDEDNKLVFERWLDGYYVGLIYGAAFRLGELGYATKELDYAFSSGPTVAGRFIHFTGTPASGACGLNTWNTCMDDHAGSAFGFAWMAAYKSRRLNHNSSYDISVVAGEASGHINDAFDSVCIRKTPLTTSGTPVCNGTITDLVNGTAQTLSVNGGRQLPHYGFGLMTSIFSALQALEIAGEPYSWRTQDEPIAEGLFNEIRLHTDQYGSFTGNTCLQPNGSSFNLVSCAGPDNYVPNLYNLGPAYTHYFSFTPSTGYKSITFNSGLFSRTTSTAYNAHFSYGRYAAYWDMGADWLPDNAPDFPGDSNDPIGYFEGISSTGVAQGWTCDKDVVNRQGRIKVDFYIDGSFPPDAEGWADASSETVINNLCDGGYAHRFWVQLPTYTKGYNVTAYGLDFTWYGATTLTCLQSGGCKW